MTVRPIVNRVTEMAGTDYPIIQAPMGWIARVQLASAVSNAGGLGIIETSSGEFDNIRNEVAKMRDLTDVSIIAAGGMCDGLSMACAFAMGAVGGADGHTYAQLF